MLEVVELTCARGERCLFKGLNFSLTPGTAAHVQGHNGSGKTTLLRAVCGLFHPQAGEIRWQGISLRAWGEDYHRKLLYLGHAPCIKADLTAGENVQMAARLAGESVSVSDTQVALARLGLKGFEELPARVLSQGQKKRVALARLALSSAKLWVLDEPFVALDQPTVAQLHLLLEAHVANGGSVLMTTHQELPLVGRTLYAVRLGN